MTMPHDPSAELPSELSLESLQRLARGLLLERGSGEDLVQEAWLAALQSRSEIRGLGGWLAGTQRRLARNRLRQEGRRAWRERHVARPEAQPSALDASARIELLQRVLAAVDRLEAPYREVVVLRYFDDLPPRAIAARLGLPVNTVRTRVRRGIERLRAELDPGPGREREALLSALVPLLGPGRTPAGEAASGLARHGTQLLARHPAALAISLLALGTIAWLAYRPGAADPARASGGTAQAAGTVGGTPVPATTASDARAPATGAQDSPAPPSRVALEAGWVVRGHVTRGEWEPYPGARLVGRLWVGGMAEGPPLVEERLAADASGAFAWAPATPAGLYTVEVAGDLPAHLERPARGWFLTGDPAPADWRVRLYPLDSALLGTVRGADGAPLAGAFVAAALGDEARAVRSGADGAFELPFASTRPPRMVSAWLPGLAPGSAPFDASAGALELVLRPELRLRGTVRDGQGLPIAGAEVSVNNQMLSEGAVPPTGGGWPKAVSDADGRYVLGGIDPRALQVVLQARAAGHRPGEAACMRPANGAPELDFACERGLTLTGQVRAAGTPAEGAWVGTGEWPGDPEGAQAWCDAEGRFTLDGLAAGRQSLWVWRRGFARARHARNVVAGMAALELELEPGHFAGGVVLGPDGAPAARALVRPEPADDAWPLALAGASTTTDDAGRFRVEDLPAERIVLAASAQGSLVLRQEVALDRDDLVLRLVAKSPAGLPPAAPAGSIVAVTATAGHALVTGRLLDPAGKARAGEEVELVPAGTAVQGPSPWRAVTDGRGEFELTGLPPGTFDARWVRREAGLVALDLETRVTLVEHEPARVELRPGGKATLRGRIELLAPAPGAPPAAVPELAVVQLVRYAGGLPAPSGRRGTFARAGAFELEGLEPGAWRVEVRLDPSAASAPIGNALVTLPAEGTSRVLVQALAPREEPR